jgi:ectoine hydroxylase-related dioxygenase (phytanoyl-CoA dioxygenase family)
MRHEGALDILAQLIGPNIRAIGHKLNMKSGSFGSPVEWHQDWAFFPHTNNNVLAIGICLDDMTEANGCLMVMPGSHKDRILDHHQDGYFVGAVTEPDFDDSAAAKLEIPAGGMSIHHGRALHGSLPNTSTGSRRLLLFTYAAADAWPIKGTSWEAYQKTLVRGELTNEPRVDQVPVRLPLPEPPRKGSIYETQTLLHRSTSKQATA